MGARTRRLRRSAALGFGSNLPTAPRTASRGTRHKHGARRPIIISLRGDRLFIVCVFADFLYNRKSRLFSHFPCFYRG